MSFDVVKVDVVFLHKDKDIEAGRLLVHKQGKRQQQQETSEMRWRGLLKDLKDTSIYFLWGLREDDEDEDFFKP